TGIEGAVSANGSVDNAIRAIDGDADNYATINLTAGVATSASLSIRDQITDYPAGTYAGFDISNPALLGLGLLDNITITTYLNGNTTPVETISGNANLLGVGSSVLAGQGRQTVGFVTTQPFDEVRITLNQVLGVNLGQTRVYGLPLQSFCDGPALDCNTPSALQGQLPTGSCPVIVNGANTAIDAVLCVGC